MDPFESARLCLRPLRPEDEALYCALYTDPGVMAHIGAPLTHAAASRQFAEACRRNGDPAGVQRRWAVIERTSGTRLGLLAVLGDGADPGNVELGVMLLPAAHGRGFARELNDAVIAEAFRSGGWGLRRVWARHAAGHGAAAGALGASGFVPATDPGDAVIVAITADRWRARHG